MDIVAVVLKNFLLNYTYDAFGRRTGIQLDNGNDYTASYTYDGMSRAATVSALGQSAQYSRVTGSNRLNSTVFSNGYTSQRSYDAFNRLTGVNGYGYTLNSKDQRTKITLPDSQYWDYTYDGMGQVTGGVKKDASGSVITGKSYAYSYDTIGNRTSASLDQQSTAYTANNVNQYTAVGAISPTYDADGNMLSNGAWSYTWNAENRLICALTATVKEEYSYDYMGRRWQVKNYIKSGAEWVLNSEKRFIYDGVKQIAEYTSGAMTSICSAKHQECYPHCKIRKRDVFPDHFFQIISTYPNQYHNVIE